MRILLVEDDKKQQQWAINSLKDYEVIIATNRQEFYEQSQRIKSEERAADVIITDLYLPDKENDPPKTWVGFEIFQESLRLLAQKKITGLAMISNYEHHAHDSEFSTKQKLFIESKPTVKEISEFADLVSAEQVRNVFRHIGKTLNIDILPNKNIPILNVVFLFDSISLYDYWLISPEGVILSPREIKHEYGENCGPWISKAIKKMGYILLKPYAEVVNALTT